GRRLHLHQERRRLHHRVREQLQRLSAARGRDHRRLAPAAARRGPSDEPTRMAQDFWSASGFRLLAHRSQGLVATDAWLRHLLDRDELRPPPGAGEAERALHASVAAAPRAAIDSGLVDSLEDEDPDAASNWREFLRFRVHVLAHATLEDAYRALFARGEVPVAPPFVDLLAELIVRAALDGTEDAWLCRAGEIFFREQRVAAEGGQMLAADRATVEMFAANGGFGSVGRLLRGQG